MQFFFKRNWYGGKLGGFNVFKYSGKRTSSKSPLLQFSELSIPV